MTKFSVVSKAIPSGNMTLERYNNENDLIVALKESFRFCKIFNIFDEDRDDIIANYEG